MPGSSRCVYADAIGCSLCTYVFFKQCPKFMSYRATELVKGLAPFKFYRKCDRYPKDFELVFGALSKIGSVGDVRKRRQQYIHYIKSACASYAFRVGEPVRRLFLKECINFTMQTEHEFTHKIYFLELYSAGNIYDIGKVTSIIETFLSLCMARGIKVFAVSDFDLDFTGRGSSWYLFPVPKK